MVKPDVYVENGYLAFKNMEAVDSVIQMLGKMTTKEKEVWETKMGFKSARADFDMLFNEYDKLESYEAFLAFKERNKGNLKFNETDPTDCSIDYPFATRYFIPVLNTKGIYKIGNSIVKYTSIEQIVILDGDLNKLNNPDKFITHERVVKMPLLKSVDLRDIYIYDEFANDNPNPQQNPNRWYTVGGDRRLRNELSRENYYYDYGVPTSGWKVIFYQAGQATNWLGNWKDYKTIYGVQNVSIKVGNFPTYSYHTNNPSYTGEVFNSTRVFASDHQIGTNALFYYRPEVIFSCDTYSRGVGIFYNVNH